ncbi:TIGR03088 family PEP-CTERM/XrtA system glycosyltransferase [Colwellia psychrerythraea]|uniref:Sugar transferase, PEP-CTERM/EpsH1 system associated protein n=1 Tax=Colwellia psychrerythraea TaxID=28229 RepID=A0A099L1B0_COLPS|nr:TIGR03088 family PEP-CTERM/XrtA system glycosyltransferase [Colwellia psychrerythraea]KGJ96774.1 sugar transferase, PEP-CTERM/EpsH1 system associated protein [Colwellia psychrerythraea]
MTDFKQPIPVIVHLIHRLDIGGLERVMLNCINQMQGENFEHVIISLTDENNFSQSANNPIKVYCLGKKEGSDLGIHFKLFTLLRKIKPAVLHTYNLPTIEYHPISWLAGVKGHIHAEHGRDIGDPQGLNKKHNFLRKLMARFINRYISVSEDLHYWLINTVGIPGKKALLIQNGINTELFNVPKTLSKKLRFTIVARISPVKDHQNLLNAFSLLREQLPAEKLPHLAIVGEGEQRAKLEQYCNEQGLGTVSFLGARNDIEQILSDTDVFVLSSIAEGIPMTILEAMSAKTPIVATRVGGIPEVVEDAKEGFLVDKSNATALAQGLLNYINQPELILEHGENARAKVLKQFNEKHMVQAYLEQYKALVKG